MPSTTTFTSSTRGRRRTTGTPRATAYQSAKAQQLARRGLLSAGTGTIPAHAGVTSAWPRILSPKRGLAGQRVLGRRRPLGDRGPQLQTGGNVRPHQPGAGARPRSGRAGKAQRERPAQLPVAAPSDPGRGRVTGNVTIVGQTSGGFLSITPTPSSTLRARRSTSRSATPGRTTSDAAGRRQAGHVYKPAGADPPHRRHHRYFLAGNTHATYSTSPRSGPRLRPGIRSAHRGFPRARC